MENKKVQELSLSDQAIGSIMMALQKSLMAATSGNDDSVDITEILKGLRLTSTNNGLVVLNPPVIKFDDQFEDAISESSDIQEILLPTE